MCRNRLRSFGHANRIESAQNGASLVKKVMYSYFPDSKRPRNVASQKRWEDKIIEDLEKFNVKNWRRQVNGRDSWYESINPKVQTTRVNPKLKQIVRDYREKADKKRSDEKKADQGEAPPEVTEILVKDGNTSSFCD